MIDMIQTSYIDRLKISNFFCLRCEHGKEGKPSKDIFNLTIIKQVYMHATAVLFITFPVYSFIPTIASYLHTHKTPISVILQDPVKFTTKVLLLKCYIKARSCHHSQLKITEM